MSTGSDSAVAIAGWVPLDKLPKPETLTALPHEHYLGGGWVFGKDWTNKLPAAGEDISYFVWDNMGLVWVGHIYWSGDVLTTGSRAGYEGEDRTLEYRAFKSVNPDLPMADRPKLISRGSDLGGGPDVFGEPEDELPQTVFACLLLNGKREAAIGKDGRPIVRLGTRCVSAHSVVLPHDTYYKNGKQYQCTWFADWGMVTFVSMKTWGLGRVWLELYAQCLEVTNRYLDRWVFDPNA